MSVNIPFIANVKTICKDLTVTTSVDVYTGSANLRGSLDSMSVCNDSAGSVNFTLQITDGTNVYKIYDVFPVASHTTLFIKEHNVQMPDGWTLQVIASGANALHVVSVIAEVSPVRSQ
ncbi:hypothetical protein GGE68_001434 [Rhizobium leguminosarum]|uniref:hypothetical protein n=1 Tax=Rhizobium leguminosarum TaxID=384 RepID=UPI001619587A|nr:hypothetical protein [Rhizobium leguminosarum]MBB5663258.1 hypothetical protein [Rhizobium leguminosarum]